MYWKKNLEKNTGSTGPGRGSSANKPARIYAFDGTSGFEPFNA